MTRIQKLLLSIFILLVLASVATGSISYLFGVKVITAGEVYGFRIGDTREKIYENAKGLLLQNKIHAIHTWPKGEYHRPFRNNENPVNTVDPSWVMIVDPEWWNNTITITFNKNEAIEIRRDRIYCELP